MLILQKRKLGSREVWKLAQVFQQSGSLTQGEQTPKSSTIRYFPPPQKEVETLSFLNLTINNLPLRLKVINRTFPFNFSTWSPLMIISSSLIPGTQTSTWLPLVWEGQSLVELLLLRGRTGVFVTIFLNRIPSRTSHPCWMSCLNRSVFSAAFRWSA